MVYSESVAFSKCSAYNFSRSPSKALAGTPSWRSMKPASQRCQPLSRSQAPDRRRRCHHVDMHIDPHLELIAFPDSKVHSLCDRGRRARSKLTKMWKNLAVRGVLWRRGLDWVISNVPSFLHPFLVVFWTTFFSSLPGRRERLSRHISRSFCPAVRALRTISGPSASSTTSPGRWRRRQITNSTRRSFRGK